MNHKKTALILCFICLSQATICHQASDGSFEVELAQTDPNPDTNENIGTEITDIKEDVKDEEDAFDEDFFGDLTDNNPIVERPLWQQRLQHIGAALFIKALETQKYFETKCNQFKKWLFPKNKNIKKKKR